MNTEDMPIANKDNLNQEDKEFLSSQEGNFGIGKMSDGVIEDNAKVAGEIEEKNNNQSQTSNNQVTVNINSKAESKSSESKEQILKMSLKEGDKEATIEAPFSAENLQSLLGFLQQRFNDKLLEFKDIEKSSIKLIIKGSEEGLNSIVKSFKSGELAPLLKQQFNLELEDTQLIDSDSSENSPKNQNQKLLAFTIAGNVSQADIHILKTALIDTSDEYEKSRLVQEIVNEPVTGRKLKDANLSGAYLRSANLSGADLRGANLSGAYLRSANRRDVNLRDADLLLANLRGANLSGANLSGANLFLTNLRGVNLRSANLGGAYLRGALIDEKTKLDDKWRLVWKILNEPFTKRNLRGADLKGVNLRSANLRSANLSSADLIGANLSYANLIGANLIGANLRGVNLSYANLISADLRDADLSYANVENTRFGNNSGIAAKMKQDLIQRGAIFEDSPGEGDRSNILILR